MTDVKVKIAECKSTIKRGSFLFVDEKLMQVVETGNGCLLINTKTGNRHLDEFVPVPCDTGQFLDWIMEHLDLETASVVTIDSIEMKVKP